MPLPKAIADFFSRKPPIDKEQTGIQALRTTGTAVNLIGSQSSAIYATYRIIRKHPTVAIGRTLAVAPILSAEWSVEAGEDAPNGAQEFIADQFLEARQPLLRDALLFGYIDYGFQSFEKVFEETDDGRIGIRKFKPLLPDITHLRVDKDTGAFDGVRQGEVILPVEHTLLYSFAVEGTNWGGVPLLENVRKTWTEWEQANAGAVKYDRKVAGSHLVVHYPPGQSTDVNGSTVDNVDIAKRIMDSLEAAGSVAIPQTVASFASDLNRENAGWDISLLQDSGGRQPTFIDRLRYLDSLILRGLILPERIALEGQHGTLAEAGEHADLAMNNAELVHEQVTRTTNWHAVDQLLALNWGDEARGTVKLVASPIQDSKRLFLTEVYKAVLANPSGFLEEFGELDTSSLRESLGVPSLDEGDDRRSDPIAIEGVDASDPDAATARRVLQVVGEEAE